MQITGSDALIVIDVQNDFTAGSMAIPGADTIIEPINRLASLLPCLVVATDWHPHGHISFASAHPGVRPGERIEARYGPQTVFADHCLQGSWGAELDPGLHLGPAHLILRKGYRQDMDSFGCFYENDQVTATGLAAYLSARGIRRVFCAGLARFGCVMHSALGAARDGFDVVIVEDASAGRARATDAEALNTLAQAGVQWVHSRALLLGGLHLH